MDGKDIIINDPVACSPAKDFFRKQDADPSAIWKNLVEAGDPINAYGWIHAQHGKSERLIKCLIELYGSYSQLFSTQISEWFGVVKTFDPKTKSPQLFALDKTHPSVDRFFAKGLSLIFSPAIGDKEGLMDTVNCVAFLGQAVTNSHKVKVEQDAALSEARRLAMEILTKEFPNGE